MTQLVAVLLLVRPKPNLYSKVLVTVDDLLGLLGCGNDVALVVSVEVDDRLFFCLLDFETFGVKALFL